MRRGCRERFPCHQLQRKPLFSDPGMHHVWRSWCMSGPLTCSGGKNVPGIPGECATPNFTYRLRGPFKIISNFVLPSTITGWDIFGWNYFLFCFGYHITMTSQSVMLPALLVLCEPTHGALILALIFAWTNRCTNSRAVGDWRRRDAHVK